MKEYCRCQEHCIFEQYNKKRSPKILNSQDHKQSPKNCLTPKVVLILPHVKYAEETATPQSRRIEPPITLLPSQKQRFALIEEATKADKLKLNYENNYFLEIPKT